jgi:hypothetical protein
MILPEDQEIIIAMVGVAIDINNPPKEFVDEYLLRLGMLGRAGRQGGLGALGMMALLRKFEVEPAAKKTPDAVSDWTRVDQGETVMVAGRRARYFGPAGSGCLLIQYEGQRAKVEVPIGTVTRAGKVVDGIDDQAFEKDPEPPAAALTEAGAKKPAAKKSKKSERVDDQPPEPEVDQEVLNAWGLVDPGSPVKVKIGEDWLDAEFADCQKDDLLSIVLDGKKMTVAASDVSKPEAVAA